MDNSLRASARERASVRLASAPDLQRLLPHVREFWKFEQLSWDTVDVAAVLGNLLADPRLGCVFVVELEQELVGYLVLTFGYSIEHGGRDALVDELYLRPDLRGAGVGARLIDSAAAACRAQGVRRLHLEVDDTNLRASQLYGRLGFARNQRFLMTMKL
ncbi:MAG: GNAT family N-acetyltransferase [Myxococcales bacterium]